jgi:hypothetical protein
MEANLILDQNTQFLLKNWMIQFAHHNKVPYWGYTHQWQQKKIVAYIPARSNWPRTSPIFGTCSGVSLHNSGSPRIACTRIYNPSPTTPHVSSVHLHWPRVVCHLPSQWTCHDYSKSTRIYRLTFKLKDFHLSQYCRILELLVSEGTMYHR